MERTKFVAYLAASDVAFGEQRTLTWCAPRRCVLNTMEFTMTTGFALVSVAIDGERELREFVGSAGIQLEPGDLVSVVVQCFRRPRREWAAWRLRRFWRLPPVENYCALAMAAYVT